MLASRRLDAILIQDQRGFSYNEVLFAVALIAVGVLGFSVNTIGVIRGNHLSANYTVAVNLAQDKMEQLKAQPVLSDVDGCPNFGERGIGAAGASGGTYDRCWTIKDSPLGVGLKEVTVTVTWRDAEHRAVTLSTLVFTE